MPVTKSPRKGSLQFWPRKRANKFLPSVNWEAINSNKKLKGFIGYKASMVSSAVKDSTPDSMTKGKTKIVPSTVIVCPPMRIFSVRLYSKGKVATEFLSDNIEKDMKRKVKIPKKTLTKISDIKSENYDDLTIITYSQVKKTGIKKKPDMIEIGLDGSLDEKINWVKENIGRELLFSEFFGGDQLVDIRGLTKGKGLVGPVKRFGLRLKDHKSEKGQRRPGSLGPWHPARVTFRVPMAGQLGMFTRIKYNNKIIKIGKAEDNLKSLKNFGDVRTEYSIIEGSVQGPAKRPLLITEPLRPTKKQTKKIYELIDLR